MPATYRDDREAAMARAEALDRENERLRAENHWLRMHGTPSDPGEMHWVRGAWIALALLLATTVSASAILRDMASAIPCRSMVFERAEQPFPGEGLQRAFAAFTEARPPSPVADGPITPAPSSPPATSPFALALAPLLQGCFFGPHGRVDLVATVDAHGRARHVYVLHRGGTIAPSVERRCVRRALSAISLPTTHTDLTAYGPRTELHLVLLPARTGRLTRRG